MYPIPNTSLAYMPTEMFAKEVQESEEYIRKMDALTDGLNYYLTHHVRRSLASLTNKPSYSNLEQALTALVSERDKIEQQKDYFVALKEKMPEDMRPIFEGLEMNLIGNRGSEIEKQISEVQKLMESLGDNNANNL